MRRESIGPFPGFVNDGEGIMLAKSLCWREIHVGERYMLWRRIHVGEGFMSAW